MNVGGENREFLGSGWRFPVELERPSGEVAAAEYEERVRQSIWIILGTAPGERAMRPDFGCGLNELVFSVDTPAARASIADAVRDALLRWEPRIDLDDVRVDDRPGEPGTLLIAVDYRVRATNNLFNFVYPFYLERAATS
jgi:phage baseplate assembly protein W